MDVTFLKQPTIWLQCGLALLAMLVAVFREDIRRRLKLPDFTKRNRLERIRERLKLLHELHNNAYGLLMKIFDAVLGPFQESWWLLPMGLPAYVGTLTILDLKQPLILLVGFSPAVCLACIAIPRLILLICQLRKINTTITALTKKGNALAMELGEQPLSAALTVLVDDPVDSTEQMEVHQNYYEAAFRNIRHTSIPPQD